MKADEDSTELLLQAAVNPRAAWLGVPPSLHFSQVKMHTAILNDALRTVSGLCVVDPRISPTKLLKTIANSTHWQTTSKKDKYLACSCCSSFPLACWVQLALIADGRKKSLAKLSQKIGAFTDSFVIWA